MENFTTHIGNNPELSKLLQEQAFAAGIGWASGNTPQYLDQTRIHVDNGILMYGRTILEGSKDVTVPEFLKALKTYTGPVRVKLNSEYTAQIKGNVVRVGCQTIEFGPILELADKIRERQVKEPVVNGLDAIQAVYPEAVFEQDRPDFRDSTVCHMVKAGATKDEIISELVTDKELYLRRIIELDLIAPKKYKLPNGTIMEWRCPSDLVPLTDLTGS